MKLNCYSDIDEMPVFNWFKIHATGDFSYMLIRKRGISEKEAKILSKKFNLIYDQYISMFGFNEEFLSTLEKRRKIALLMIKKATTGDRTLNTLIKVHQAELNSMEEQKPAKSNFYEIKSFVEKQMGFQINIRTMSVAEFYTSFNSVSNGQN